MTMSKSYKPLLNWVIALTVSAVYLVRTTSADAATLTLIPEQQAVGVNELTTMQLWLDPGEDLVVGTDIFLKYDPLTLEVVSVGSTGALPNMPANQIDNTAGILKVSLANPFGQYLTSAESIAKLTLRTKAQAAQTALSFDYTPGSTKDTNVVVAGGTDVLTAATGTRLTVHPTASDNPSNNTTASDNGNSANSTSDDSSTSETSTTLLSVPVTADGRAASPPLRAGFVSPLPELPEDDGGTGLGQVLGKASDNAKKVAPAVLDGLSEATRSKNTWPLIMFGLFLGLAASIILRWVWMYGLPSFGIRKAIRRMWDRIPVRVVVTKQGVQAQPEPVAQDTQPMHQPAVMASQTTQTISSQPVQTPEQAPRIIEAPAVQQPEPEQRHLYDPPIHEVTVRY